ncbi:phosphodiester glycosidase family protein [Gryllotalpicola reticulitermitis]|uniref:Phosphodiester glycosidase family protein n=1 Tax=Gryllotalpicola reticulitermitis TaxID=1184153 RepID=A0ABV8Q8Z2_9MICO
MRLRQPSAETGLDRELSRQPRAVHAALAALVIVVVIVIAWLGISLAGALTAPGTDPTSARVAEWGRQHGLGWAVTGMEQAQYQLSKPKTGGVVAGGLPTIGKSSARTRPNASASQPATGHATATGQATTTAPPPPLAPLVHTTTLAGEGAWHDLFAVHGRTAARVAFLRPDSLHTSYYVQVIWMDPRLVSFTLYPGYKVPGAVAGAANRIPTAKLGSVLATFNSGFLMTDARGGYWQNGHAVVPLRTGAASMVFTTDGHVRVESWPGGAPGPGIAAVRQNLDPLIQHGVISPAATQANAAAWGRTVGNLAYVWRSGIGVRADGSIVSVVGPAMDVETLANVLHDAGAVTAMELDINPSWTNYITYTHPSSTTAMPTLLPPANPYVHADRYLQPSSRDFVAVYPR